MSSSRTPRSFSNALLVFALFASDGFQFLYATKKMRVIPIRMTMIQINEKLFTNALPEITPKWSSSGRSSSVSSHSMNASNPGISLNGMKLNDHVDAFRDDK